MVLVGEQVKENTQRNSRKLIKVAACSEFCRFYANTYYFILGTKIRFCKCAQNFLLLKLCKFKFLNFIPKFYKYPNKTNETPMQCYNYLAI